MLCLHPGRPETGVFIFGEPPRHPGGAEHQPQTADAAVHVLKVAGETATCGVSRRARVSALDEACDAQPRRLEAGFIQYGGTETPSEPRLEEFGRVHILLGSFQRLDQAWTN